LPSDIQRSTFILMSYLARTLFATFLALLALLIGILTKHNVSLTTPLKAWLAGGSSLSESDHQFGLYVLAPGVDPVVECVNQLYCTSNTYSFHLVS
jgi:hypothetical protein